MLQSTHTPHIRIGANLKVRIVEWEGKKIKLQMWDTLGRKVFRDMVTPYFRGVHVSQLQTAYMSLNNYGLWGHCYKYLRYSCFYYKGALKSNFSLQVWIIIKAPLYHVSLKNTRMIRFDNVVYLEALLGSVYTKG